MMKQAGQRGPHNPTGGPTFPCRCVPTERRSSHERTDFLRCLLERSQEVAEADGAAAMFLEAGQFRVAAATGVLDPLCGRSYPAPGSIVERALRLRGPVVANDLSDAQPARLPLFELAGAERALAVPIGWPAEGEAVLVLAAGAGRRPFGEEDLGVAERLVDQVSSALESVVLQRELRRRDERIESLRVELEQALQTRRRFLAAFNHELRTPLNAIVCYNDLLVEGVLGPLNARQQHAVLRIAAAGRRLRDLIEALFDLTELESGKVCVDVAPVELRAIAEGVLSRVRQEAEERGVSLAVEAEGADARVETDAAKVERILLSLYRHVLDALGSGAALTVRIGPHADGVRVAVTDAAARPAPDGPEHSAREPGPLTPELAGTGPGLPLAARLAELLGGRILAQGRSGEALALYLHLPARVPVQA